MADNKYKVFEIVPVSGIQKKTRDANNNSNFILEESIFNPEHGFKTMKEAYDSITLDNITENGEGYAEYTILPYVYIEI